MRMKTLGNSYFLFLLTIASLIQWNECLFEDQAFKFDWKKDFIGVVKKAEIVGGSGGSAGSRRRSWIMATESNVLASLDPSNGELRWRHVFQETLFDMTLNNNNLITLSVSAIRTWNHLNGVLRKEIVYDPPIGPNIPDMAFVIAEEESVYFLYINQRNISVKTYDLKTGKEKRPVFSILSLDRVGKCVMSSSYLCCLNEKKEYFYYLRLPDVNFSVLDLEALGFTKLPVQEISLVSGSKNNMIQIISEKEETVLVTFDNEGKMKKTQMLQQPLSSSLRGSGEGIIFSALCDDKMIYAEQKCDGNFKSCSLEFSVAGGTMNLKEERGKMKNVWVDCQGNEQLLLQFEDGSIVTSDWVRDDGLADIIDVQLVSLVTINDETREKAGVLEQFCNRIKRHLELLTRITDINKFFHLEKSSDEFGMRKIILAVTRHGKIYGIDSSTGSIIWHLMYYRHSKDDQNVELFVVDHQKPKCTLVFTVTDDRKTYFFSFDPINGNILSELEETSEVSQVMLLHFQMDEDGARPLILLKKDNSIQLEPPTAFKKFAQVASSIFIVTRDEDNMIYGRRIVVRQDVEKIDLPIAWSIRIPATKIVVKPFDNRVHSQGRVLADRSVLFKYVNPNLAVILSEDNIGSAFSIFLVDLVTGRILFSATHKRVSGPYNIVHSENWVVYSYYNEKARRSELGCLELFEGNTQVNETVFSSFQNTIMPLVERQAFILGSPLVTAMKETITEKGITSKHILIATHQGAIYNVPRQFLDPRRPNINTPLESREPGLPPYMPELHLPPEMILNYNQTILSPRGIVTAPTGLESTSIVFVYGLDLYCTQVTPSKGFDLLNDDFDHYIIATVLMGLVIAAYITRRLAQRKNIKQSWK